MRVKHGKSGLTAYTLRTVPFMARQASVSLTVSAPPYTHVTYEVSLTGA